MKITYFNKDVVWRSLRQFVSGLTEAHPEVRRVLLFGSLARGDAVPGSDVDLLLVLAASDEPFLDRIPRYTPSPFPVPVEVFPYTEEELAALLAQGNRFIQRALSEGVSLLDVGSEA